MDYKKTLNLPKTEFPMRANLPKREPKLASGWSEVAKRWAERRAPWFVLHDGPPYSNGHIHVGHALNKVLKDFINKYKALKGFRVHFVPGWDTHGMPIENEVTKHDPEFSKLTAAERTPEVAVKIREKCRVFALHWVDVQREEFKRLGVIANWEKPYLTLDPDYEATELEILAQLVEEGYVYRGRMPLHWCPHHRTALAMAEIEYRTKRSPSLWFLAKVKKDPKGLFRGEPAYALVWTTTPWTLLANRAFAFGPEVSYGAYRVGEKLVIVAEALKSQAEEAMPSLKGAKLALRFLGSQAEGLVFENPLFPDLESPAVLSEFVSLEMGTGVVHTAPGHGHEDFIVGKRYGIEPFSPVDEAGLFTAEADEQTQYPLGVKGLFVDEGGKRAIERLEERGLLVHLGEIEHQYPHCWRCKNPLIFRTTSQWFLSVDHKGLRKRALEAIPKVKWHPPASRTRITASVAERPDWCISRQRSWGVHIPALYCKSCGREILDPEVIRKVAQVIREEGSDAWLTEPVEKFLPEGFRCPHCGGDKFEKEKDVLDVWFDSGVTGLVVLAQRGMDYPADVYLEGPDQHRGWFNASLMLGLAVAGSPPYKAVITHGWVLDQEGRAMHTSLGNVISPLEVVDKYGADILRLWVGFSDYTQDVKLGDEILARVVDAYRKIRNTFRFCLGNLYDFDPETDQVAYRELNALDRYLLHRLAEVVRGAEEAYESWEFHRAVHLIHDFVVTEISALYMNAVKDRLYTWAPKSRGRRAAQTVLYHVLRTLNVVLAPVLSHTAEEVHSFTPGPKAESVFLESWPQPPEEWLDESLKAEFEKVLEVRELALKALEVARKEKDIIGDPLEAKVSVEAQGELARLLEKYEAELKEALVVSQLELGEAKGEVLLEGEGFKVGVSHAEGKKCARCWMWSPEVGSDGRWPDVCPKCVRALEEIEGASS